MDATQEAGNDQNGVGEITLEKVLNRYVPDYHEALWVKHGEHGEGRSNPNDDREDTIQHNLKSIDDMVSGVVSGSKELNEHQARKIIKELAFRVAQTEGYGKPISQFSEADVIKYLRQASEGTRNPTVGNYIQLVSSIMNLDIKDPKHQRFARDSPLGVLMSYVATQQDTDSKYLEFLREILAQYGSKPGDGEKIQDALGNAFKVKFKRTATMSDVIGHIERATQIEVAKYRASGKKDYLEASPMMAKNAANYAAQHTS